MTHNDTLPIEAQGYTRETLAVWCKTAELMELRTMALDWIQQSLAEEVTVIINELTARVIVAGVPS